MRWKVNYTEDAEQDLLSIFDYISSVLLEPVTAANQTDRIMDAADALDHMPLRYRLHDKEPWRSKGLRVMPVDNYLVFYLPDEAEKTVAIIRKMYAGRDIDKHLDETEDPKARTRSRAARW
jgi:toxin ParE1/3/4